MSEAILLISYGAPEKREDVVAYLNHLFAGKTVSQKHLDVAAQKYYDYAETAGHYSPLNIECRKLLNGINAELQRQHLDMPVYWGNLYWKPLLKDVIKKMSDDGVQKIRVLATSAWNSSVVSKRYHDALDAVLNEESNYRSRFSAVDFCSFPNEHPLFIEAQTDTLLQALANNALAGNAFEHKRKRIVLFSAHSVPKNTDGVDDYVKELNRACNSVIGRIQETLDWKLVFQSASGQSVHWLAPDIRNEIQSIAEKREYESVIVSPLGFFLENMETEYDLDIEVATLCKELNIRYDRAESVGAAEKICRTLVVSSQFCDFSGGSPAIARQ